MLFLGELEPGSVRDPLAFLARRSGYDTRRLRAERPAAAAGRDRPQRVFLVRRLTRRAVAFLLAALVLVLLVLTGLFGFTTYRVDSYSMEPTLACAAGPGCTELRPDKILVSKLSYWFFPVGRGDMVVFHGPGIERSLLIVKRVVAVGGDTVEEKGGRIYVNGAPISDSYVGRRYRDARSFPARRIPRGAYFVLGDNRRRSRDSRDFGPIKRSAIVGKVIAIVSPFHRIRLL
jgi:signal peptidase I